MGKTTKPKGLKLKLNKEHLKINLTMPPAMDQYLANLGVTMRDQGGYKLSKTMIVRALIRLLQDLDLKLDGIKSEDDFLVRLKEAVSRFKKK